MRSSVKSQTSSKDPDWVPSHEESLRLRLFSGALNRLFFDDRLKWGKNRTTYENWSVARRLDYIDYIEEQAKLELPMAKELMVAVIALRMAA